MKPSALRLLSEHPWSGRTAHTIQDALIACPSLRVDERTRFVFQRKHLLALLNGRKRSTVRYSSGCIEKAVSSELPVCIDRLDHDLRRRVQEVGTVIVDSVAYKRFEDLDLADAVSDGFQDEDGLKAALIRIYGEINDSEFLTIFYISKAHDLSASAVD